MTSLTQNFRDPPLNSKNWLKKISTISSRDVIGFSTRVVQIGPDWFKVQVGRDKIRLSGRNGHFKKNLARDFWIL